MGKTTMMSFPMAPNGHRKMPLSVDVIGKRYAIEMKPSARDYGQCHYEKTLITIDDKQSMEQMRDTILHETMHAVSHELGCKLTEKQVSRMATGILQVLRHNAGLVRFLTD